MTKKMLSEHFSEDEFRCKCGCGGVKANADLLVLLEDIRFHFGSAVRINSGYRCEKHNKAVGGAPASTHLSGLGADIKVIGVDPQVIYAYADKKLGKAGGVALYPTWVHVDVRKKKWRANYR